MIPQELLPTFVVECRELLEAMEARLLAVKGSEPDAEVVNELFRVAHTIKGSAGLCDLDCVVQFAHAVEGVLDQVREGGLQLDDALVGLLLPCCDHLRALVAAIEAGQSDVEAGLARAGALLIDELTRHRKGPRRDRRADGGRVGAEAASARDVWQLSLKFGSAALKNGLEPLSLIRYLQELGEIVDLTTMFDALPAAEQMDPEACYLGFEIALRSSADEAALAGAFELARDDCEVRIRPPRSNGDPRSSAPLVKPSDTEPARAREQRSVRVDADKLDRLINLVGELIIASANTSLIARRAQLPELQHCTATLGGLVEAVRDNALQLRMVKIGATFKRFQRVVYDVARELGKDITLSVSGEDAELDKTVVEHLGDPLLHLVRNAIDHGIEPIAERTARGKPATGTVRLNAYHDAGSIVIEVSDDGGGLKRDAILAKGLQRGLVDPGRSLSDAEVFNLIFEPGFSTAKQVTSLSGRGVGMDVVKRSITELRGSVGVSSREGLGTTVTVRLPLTLAIINGFLIGLDQSVFVVPLEMIEECMELGVDTDRDYADLRDSVLPFIRLRQLFGLKGAPAGRQNVVVVRSGTERAGLVVDTLLGEFQTVIKPLGKMFNRVKCISGSSILGNGEVALILDVPALVEQAAQTSSRSLQREMT